MTYDQVRTLELRRPARAGRLLRAPRAFPAAVEPDEVLRPAPEEDRWWPELFPAGDPAARARLAARVVEGGFRVYDTLGEQLAELIETREPTVDLTPEALRVQTAIHLRGAPLAHYGTWLL